MLGAIINGVASLADTVGGWITNKKNREWQEEQTEKQHQFDIEQMEYSNRLNRENYDYAFQKNAEYNSPQAQVNRMIEAGLNPAFSQGSAVSTGGVEMGNVNTPASVNPAPLSSPYQRLDIQNTMTNFFNLMMMMKKNKADIDFENAQTKTQESIQALNDVKTAKELTGKNFWEQNEKFSSDALKLKNDLFTQQINDLTFKNSNLNPLAARVQDLMSKKFDIENTFLENTLESREKFEKWKALKEFEDYKISQGTSNFTNELKFEEWLNKSNYNKKQEYILDLFKMFDGENFDKNFYNSNGDINWQTFLPMMWKTLLIFSGVR